MSKQIRDKGRFFGGWIYLIAGLTLAGIAGYESWADVRKALASVEWLKTFWCVGFAWIGFAFDAFKASRTVGRDAPGAWPLYLRFYFLLVTLVGFLVYCAIDIYTSEKSYFFYFLSAFLASALGYQADRLRDLSKLIPGKLD
jgi:hypothetical protein